MNFTKPLAQLLGEEETAWKMAQRASSAADSYDDAVFAAELEVFTQFLSGDLELHFVGEETDVFPKLVARELGSEVGEALRQHGEIRRLRDELTATNPKNRAHLRVLLRDLALVLARHVHFEADYLYVDVTRPEVAAFRERVDESIASSRRAPPEPKAG